MMYAAAKFVFHQEVDVNSENTNQQENIPSMLDNRMSDLLQQLQLRRAREDVRETHPWRGWTPPKEEDTNETSTSTLNTIDVDIIGNFDSNITGISEGGKGVEDIGQLVNRLNASKSNKDVKKNSNSSKSGKGKEKDKKDKKSKKSNSIAKLAAATGLSMVDMLEKKSEIL